MAIIHDESAYTGSLTQDHLANMDKLPDEGIPDVSHPIDDLKALDAIRDIFEITPYLWAHRIACVECLDEGKSCNPTQSIACESGRCKLRVLSIKQDKGKSDPRGDIT